MRKMNFQQNNLNGKIITLKSKYVLILLDAAVLLQQILQHLDSILENLKGNKELKAYKNKLEKVIDKVQHKRKSEPNWIEFLGFSPQNESLKISDSASLKVEHQEQKQVETKVLDDTLQQEINKLREQNKRLIQSLNILTIQIQNKQKEVTSLKEKYSKVKNKKEILKIQISELHKQYEAHLQQNSNKKEKISQQIDPFPKSNQKSKHFHTYSLDRDFHNRNSNFLVPSQNQLKIGEDSQNLFTLSDTPFIGDKKKEVPVSLQYLEVRKKLLSSENTISERERTKNRKSYFSDARGKVINENSYEPSCSINYEKDLQQQSCLKFILLSQSLAIQKLLQRI